MKLWMAPAGLHIEPAQAKDADTIAKLHAQGFYRGWPREDFASYITGEGTPLVAAQRGGRGCRRRDQRRRRGDRFDAGGEDSGDAPRRARHCEGGPWPLAEAVPGEGLVQQRGSEAWHEEAAATNGPGSDEQVPVR